MAVILTSLAVLLGITALLGGLRHRFYVLHIVLVAGGGWLLEQRMTGLELFALRTFFVVLALHMVFINIVTFLAYWRDKRAASKGKWRIPERTLQAFALIGGSPAAFLAQRKFRHKTRKKSFQAGFVIVLVLQGLLLLVLGVNSFWQINH